MIVRVTIAGSYRKHLHRIYEARDLFHDAGAEVLRPREGAEPNPPDDVVLAQDTRLAQFQAIDTCDVLYIVNPGGYIGPATTLEAGYAYRAGVPVFSQEPPSDNDVAAICAGSGSPEEVLVVFEESKEKHS